MPPVYPETLPRERPHPGALVAVVENNPATLAMLDDLLCSEGYRTLLQPAAKDAHLVLRQARPDLVILDLWLEDQDAGETLLGLLELDATTRTIPVIVCSAHLDLLRTKAALLRRRGYRVLAKPFQVDALLAAIHAMIGPAQAGGDSRVREDRGMGARGRGPGRATPR
jgi:DNA-binding response OmpR family regulator